MSDKSNLIPLLIGVTCAGGLFLAEYVESQQQISTPFYKAASVGQFTHSMAESDCQQYNDDLNYRLKTARGDNKFVPVQRAIVPCDKIIVVTDALPAKAPAGP